MATVYVSMGAAGARMEAGGVELFRGDRLRSETITSSGTSAAGSLTAEGISVAKISCASAIYATSRDGDATATNGVYIEANRPEYLILTDGQSIKVIDV